MLHHVECAIHRPTPGEAVCDCCPLSEISYFLYFKWAGPKGMGLYRAVTEKPISSLEPMTATEVNDRNRNHKLGGLGSCFEPAIGRLYEAVKKVAVQNRNDNLLDPMRDVFLTFPRAVREVARVTAFGDTKHATGRWTGWGTTEEGIDRYTRKLGRHLLAEVTEGPVNEEDGDVLHAAQVAWNALARLELMMKLDQS